MSFVYTRQRVGRVIDLTPTDSRKQTAGKKLAPNENFNRKIVGKKVDSNTHLRVKATPVTHTHLN